jgi:hypothetical protein
MSPVSIFSSTKVEKTLFSTANIIQGEFRKQSRRKRNKRELATNYAGLYLDGLRNSTIPAGTLCNKTQKNPFFAQLLQYISGVIS